MSLYFFRTRIITFQSKLSKYILTNQNSQNIFLCHWVDQCSHGKWPILPFGIAKLRKSVSAAYSVLTLCLILRFISWYNLYRLIVNITWDTVKLPHLFVVIWCNCWVLLCQHTLLPLISSLLQFRNPRTLSTYGNQFTIEIKIVTQRYVRT